MLRAAHALLGAARRDICRAIAPIAGIDIVVIAFKQNSVSQRTSKNRVRWTSIAPNRPFQRATSSSTLDGMLWSCLALLLASAHGAVIGIDLGSRFLKVGIIQPGTGIELVLNEATKRKSSAVVHCPACAARRVPRVIRMWFAAGWLQRGGGAHLRRRVVQLAR